MEVATLPNAVAVRDSKNPDGDMLTFDSARWAAFMARVRNGSYGVPL